MKRIFSLSVCSLVLIFFEGSMFSLKVTLMSVMLTGTVAPLSGLVEMTVGGVVSAMTLPPPPPPLLQAAVRGRITAPSTNLQQQIKHRGLCRGWVLLNSIRLNTIIYQGTN
jgi:hypothetical protein